MSGYNAFASVYDVLTQNVNYAQRAEDICSLFCRYGKKSGILLDVACGTGSFSEAFARRGYDVIGIDASEEMLMEAQRKMYEKGLPILYLQQDMRSLDLYGTVDCATCLLDGVNHLPTVTDVEQALFSIGFFMEKDGIFIFDVNTTYKQEKILADNTFVYDLDEVYCVWQNQFVPEDSRTDMRLDLFFPENGCYRRETEEFSEWYYSDAVLTKALQKANFELLERLPERAETTPEGEMRLYYVCRKTKNQ